MTDTPDNVVALRPGNQLTVEQITQLRTDGILVDGVPPFEELELGYPGAGEHVVGELTGSEADLFANYHAAFTELDRLRRDIGGNIYQAMGDTVRQGQEPNMEFLVGDTIDAETGRALHRLWRRTEVLKNLLFWQLGERFDCHEYVLGVRRNRKVVRGNRKY